MPLILLWGGLALLLGIVASANGRSFWGWYITLIIFMACLLFIITTLGNMAGF